MLLLDSCDLDDESYKIVRKRLLSEIPHYKNDLKGFISPSKLKKLVGSKDGDWHSDWLEALCFIGAKVWDINIKVFSLQFNLILVAVCVELEQRTRYH